MRRHRFLVALPRDPLDNRAPEIVATCRLAALRAPALWCEGATQIYDLEERGLILGILFSKHDFHKVCEGKAVSLAMGSAAATARHLVENYWGGYLAILRDGIDQPWAILRDPSGHLPVYRLATRRYICLATDPEMLSPVVEEDLRVSFPAVRSHLLRPQLRARRTCLEDIDELVPGALTDPRLSGDSGTAVWNETDFLPRGRTPAFEEAATDLRALSVSVMSAWGDAFGTTAVAASGGVDSSFLAAALAGSGNRFGCITVATPDPSGDERRHARILAAGLGVSCIETTLTAALFDPLCSASQGLPSPARRAFVAAYDRLLDVARRQIGASVVLDGNGGDNLFCFLHSSAPIIDRLRAEGPGSKLVETFFDMCRITGCSVPTMALSVLRRAASQRPGDYWPADSRLLVREESSCRVEPLTPWTNRFKGRRSGKQDHLSLIVHAQNHVHGLTTPVERFSPLASQPIVEFCLGIPSWVWARGGINRALARAAFARDLPPSILARTSKAGPDSFLRETFAGNRSVIAERLLEGLLAANGVIDRVAVEEALCVDERTDESLVDRLLDLLEAENWCRSWA